MEKPAILTCSSFSDSLGFDLHMQMKSKLIAGLGALGPFFFFGSSLLAFLDFLNSVKFLQWGQNHVFGMLSILRHDK